MADQHSRFHYDGFSSPNGTIVPDDFFDVLAPNLSEAELRVLLYIIRRTFGFKKDKDNISLKQMVEGIRTKDGKVLDRGAGVAKSAAARAAKGLVTKGVIIATRNSSPEKGDEPTTYQIRFRGGEKGLTLPVSSKRTRGVPPKEHARVLERDTQETVSQPTDVNHSNIRKAESWNNSGESEEREESVNTRRGGGFSSIANTLGRSKLRVSPRPYGEERQVIMDYVAKFAKEFNDRASLKTSTTRAYNLFVKAGVPLGAFIGRMYEAHAITKESAAAVPKRLDYAQPGTTPRGRPAKNRMAYWFSVLEDRLGLRARKMTGGGDREAKGVQESSWTS